MQLERSGSDSPTTSYKTNGVDDALPPVPPNQAPSTPLTTSLNSRRKCSPDPNATSLLPDEEKNEEMDNNESSTSASIGCCGEVEDQGQRATVTGMICRKSKAFMFGQMLSLFLAATGAVQSSLYLDCGLSAPTFSMLSFYLPLCLICTIRLVKQAKENQSLCSSSQEDGTELIGNEPKSDSSDESFRVHENGTESPATFNGEEQSNMLSKSKPFTLCRFIPLQSPPWKYAGVAIADVYANYTTILAFKYTTITSVSLFDALAIPSAMLVSRLFFSRRYTKIHMLAVLVCCIGIGINVIQDYIEDERLKESGGVGETAQEELVEEEYPYKMAGDALAITGGILFGVSNTLAEIAVRDWGTQDEFISAMSFFATIITFLQTLITERQEVKAFFSTSSESCSEVGSLTLLAIFVIATVVNYLGVASFLGMSDAAFLNLSLLTGDAWAVAFSVFAEGIVPPPTFYVALCITVSGVFIYETAPSPSGEDTNQFTVEKDENGIEMRSHAETAAHILT